MTLHTLHILIMHIIYCAGLSFESLEEWKEFLWLPVPGVILISRKWWAIEVGSFVTGSIDGVQLAAYTILLNIVSVGFVVSVLLLHVGYSNVVGNTFTHTRTHARTHTNTHTHTFIALVILMYNYMQLCTNIHMYTLHIYTMTYSHTLTV